MFNNQNLKYIQDSHGLFCTPLLSGMCAPTVAASASQQTTRSAETMSNVASKLYEQEGVERTGQTE